jgi:hypothetical protein
MLAKFVDGSHVCSLMNKIFQSALPLVLEGKHERLDVPLWMPVKSIDKQLD